MGAALDHRRELRQAATNAETALWRHLRGRRLGGFKFRRQYPCGPFILDFYCPARRVAIELDGGHHWDEETRRYDRRREEHLAAKNITVLRFPNNVIFEALDAVLTVIAGALAADGPSP